LRLLAQTQLSHDRWQRSAATAARAVDAEHHMDVIHHVTLAAYWMRTGIAVLHKPLVWGPVGGAVEPPRSLLSELGLRGGVEALVRTSTRRIMAARKETARTARNAQVIFVQNPATQRRVRALGGHAEVLPNALCARVDGVLPSGPRRREVAVVGRVVGWKAVPLAVRALALLPDDVPLYVYGDAHGSERARVLAAGRRWGVAHRVHLCGNVPRADLLPLLASTGVVLHPSLHDEASFSVAEALSLGTPVVLLDHGGPPAVAAHWPGSEVRLVPPGRPAETARRLARAVEELLNPLRPVAGRATEPDVDFAASVLAAYDRAVSR